MFLHQQDNTININNQIRLTVDQFRTLEPTYPNLPLGYTERYYSAGKTHHISGPDRVLINEGSVWQDGDRYFERYDEFARLHAMIEKQENEIKSAVQAELDRLKPYQELRMREYPNIEKMVVAMWENLIEKQTKEVSGVKEIQKLRKAIKDKYPKTREQ